jgi:hypothetical protein
VTIVSLLKHGLYAARFNAPEAGTATIEWYYLPPGAKLGKKTKPLPVLVASGSLTFRASGTATIKLHLTGEARRLLKDAKRIRLTATCAFKPAGQTAVKTSVGFELKR